MVHPQDLTELRRMATNLYDDDKARINRIIRSITDQAAENNRLKAEVKALKEAAEVKP